MLMIIDLKQSQTLSTYFFLFLSFLYISFSTARVSSKSQLAETLSDLWVIICVCT